MKKGLFITFEGGEGTGKTTQIELIQKALSSKGLPVLTSKEPGGTPIGKELRRLLLDSRYQITTPYAEILIFTVDRLEHVAQKIKPALETGKIVLCDRFIDSTIAYQEAGRQVDPAIVNYMNSLIDIRPGLTFLFDLDPKIGIKRARARTVADEDKDESAYDRFETEKLRFHQKVREKYLLQAKRYPERIVVIEIENLSEQQVFDRIYPIILNKLK